MSELASVSSDSVSTDSASVDDVSELVVSAASVSAAVSFEIPYSLYLTPYPISGKAAPI